MANPITPAGFRRDVDIVEEAASQDEERADREDEAHFRATGINRRPRRLDSPLVDDNPSPNIAVDGDSYEVEEHYPDVGGYSEDSPTQFIDNTPSQNSRRQNNGLTEVQQRLLNGIRGLGLDGVRDLPASQIPAQIRNPRQRTVDAYNKREKEREEKEFDEIKKNRIEQCKNSIMELNIEE